MSGKTSRRWDELADAVRKREPARFEYDMDGTARFACELAGTNGDFAVRILPSKDPEAPAALVYAGDRSLRREGTTVYRWDDL